MRHDAPCDLAGQLPHSLTLSCDTLLWDSHYFLPGGAGEKNTSGNVLAGRWYCYPLMVCLKVGCLHCSLCWADDNGVHCSYVCQSVTFLLSFFSYSIPFREAWSCFPSTYVFIVLFRQGSGSIACSFDSRISFNGDSDAWYKSWLFIHTLKVREDSLETEICQVPNYTTVKTMIGAIKN